MNDSNIIRPRVTKVTITVANPGPISYQTTIVLDVSIDPCPNSFNYYPNLKFPSREYQIPNTSTRTPKCTAPYTITYVINDNFHVSPKQGNVDVEIAPYDVDKNVPYTYTRKS